MLRPQTKLQRRPVLNAVGKNGTVTAEDVAIFKRFLKGRKRLSKSDLQDNRLTPPQMGVIQALRKGAKLTRNPFTQFPSWEFELVWDDGRRFVARWTIRSLLFRGLLAQRKTKHKRLESYGLTYKGQGRANKYRQGVCTACGSSKNPFYYDKHNNRFRSKCILCVRVRSNKYYHRHSDRLSLTQSAFAREKRKSRRRRACREDYNKPLRDSWRS